MGRKGEVRAISQDYWNEFCGRYMIYQVGGFPEVLASLRRTPVQKYYERYPEERLERRCADTLRGLDTIVDRMNDAEMYSPEQFLADVEEARGLIYGKDKRPLLGSEDLSGIRRLMELHRNGNEYSNGNDCRTTNS